MSDKSRRGGARAGGDGAPVDVDGALLKMMRRRTPGGPGGRRMPVPAVLAALGLALLLAPAVASGTLQASGREGRSAVAPAVVYPVAGASAAPGDTSAEERSLEDLVREADAAFAREEYRAARRLYELAVERAGAVHTLSRLALLQSWDGDLRQSVQNYRRALEMAPEDVDLRLDLARVLSWRDELGEAIHIYEDLRAAHPDDARVLLGLGRTLAWRGSFEQADAVYVDMEERRIEPIAAHIGRARLLGWQGNYDRAAHFYRDVLRADPGNLDARIGLAQVEHWQGLHRAALEQIDNIVLDHPDSREAKELQTTVHDALRPHGDLEGFRFSDNDSNRVDAATAAWSFMAEPQTSVRMSYSTYAAEFRCEDLSYCNEAGPGVNEVVSSDAAMLTAGVTSRLIKPIGFHARVGVMREETFGETTRNVLVGGGYISWQVGRRLALTGLLARDALVDTAVLIDRGIRVDSAEGRIDFRFKPSWTLSGSAAYALYSDRNVRQSAAASLEWRLPGSHPWITARLDLSYRTFFEDKDNGYFDPLRYDSEVLTVAIWDRYLRDRLFWRIEGTYGRQDFETGAGPGQNAGSDDTVQAIYASFGTALWQGATLEAYYARSDYALQLAAGFSSTRSGFALRARF